MNIKEFAEKVCNEVAKTLGKEVQIREVDKLNGVKRYGLTIKNSDSNVEPTVYLEAFYQMYMEGGNWSDIIHRIITCHQDNSLHEHIDMEWFKDFSKVQGLIFHKLINYDANTKLLEDIPYTRYLDFAIVYCVHYKGVETGSGSILIHNSHLEMWHRTTQDLARLAEENTPRLFPLTVSTMGDLIQDCIGSTEECPINLKDIEEIPMHVMSNKERFNGAISICYKGALQDFSKLIKSDVIILPSSLHEVILLPFEAKTDLNELKGMVYQVNRTQLTREEFLSDNVYLYRRETDSIEIAA